MLLTERLSYAFGDPAAVATLRGLAVEAEESASRSRSSPPRSAAARRPRRPCARALVDACFVYALPEGHPSVAAALERRLPVVVGDTPRVPGVPFVSVDDRGGARAAAQHLLDLGHRRLAVAAFRIRDDDRTGFADGERRRGAAYRVTRERLAGYADAIAAAGLEWDERPDLRGQSTRASSAARRRSRCSRHDPPPTAMLAMSDEIALGIVDGAARDAGVDVPGRALGRRLRRRPAPPPPRGLTTVRQPLVEKGRTAGRMLLEAIDGGTPADVAAPHRARRPRLDPRVDARP